MNQQKKIRLLNFKNAPTPFDLNQKHKVKIAIYYSLVNSGSNGLYLNPWKSHTMIIQ